MMASTKKGCAMQKKHIVRLTDAQRELLKEIVGK